MRKLEPGEEQEVAQHAALCAAYGVLCALLALCDALLTLEGGNSTLQTPSRALPPTRGRQGCFGRYGGAYSVRN